MIRTSRIAASRQPLDRAILQTRSTFDCVTGFMSPISFQNSVPPEASSNFLSSVAPPGKRSASNPNNSDSISVSGSAAQFLLHSLAVARDRA